MITFVLLAARLAAADAIPECPTKGTIAPATKIAADRKTTYELTGTDLKVCVDRAVYPYYGAGKGHRLLACFTIASGKASTRLCGDGNNVYADFRGYRVHVSLRTPRYTDSCEVSLMVEPAPPPKTG